MYVETRSLEKKKKLKRKDALRSQRQHSERTVWVAESYTAPLPKISCPNLWDYKLPHADDAIAWKGEDSVDVIKVCWLKSYQKEFIQVCLI